MLDALVLTEWPGEHGALLGILGRTPQRVAADADRLGADQDALGVEAVEDIGEALAFLADPVLFGNEQPIDEDRVRIHGLAAHFRDEMDVDLAAIEIGIEDGDAVGGLDRKSTRLNSSH